MSVHIKEQQIVKMSGDFHCGVPHIHAIVSGRKTLGDILNILLIIYLLFFEYYYYCYNEPPTVKPKVRL